MDEPRFLYGFNTHDLQGRLSIGQVAGAAILGAAFYASNPEETIEQALAGIRFQLWKAGVEPHVSEFFCENLRTPIRNALQTPEDEHTQGVRDDWPLGAMDDRPRLYGFNRRDLQSSVSVGEITATAILGIAYHASDPGEVIGHAFAGIRSHLRQVGVTPYVSNMFCDNLWIALQTALQPSEALRTSEHP
jgi:hypothetical protein